MDFSIHRFESVTSTNDTAFRMAGEDAPEGTVVVAREQIAGKGRYGREWISPPGAGLYLSVLFRPDMPFERLWQLAFVAALASAEAVREVSGLQARVKWPNDVLLGGKKVCGILVEAKPPAVSSQQSAAGSQPSVIVGIGINVNVMELPPEVAGKATSIARELGRPVAVEDVEKALLSRLGARYAQLTDSGFPPILEAWMSLDCTVGRPVTVSTPDGEVEGFAAQIGPDGNLIVNREDGSTASISAGEVTLERRTSNA